MTQNSINTQYSPTLGPQPGALIDKIFNTDPASFCANWKKSGYNILYRELLTTLSKINASVAQSTVPGEGIQPFSKQEFDRIFAQEFISYRCADIAEDDTPIVWDTIPTRMLHDLGKSRPVKISEEGATPTEAHPTTHLNQRELFSSLRKDKFWSVICCKVPSKRNIAKLLVTKIALRILLENRTLEGQVNFNQNEVSRKVMDTTIFEQIKVLHFFETPDKAVEFIKRTLLMYGLTVASLNRGDQKINQNSDSWKLICSNGDYFLDYMNWLYKPDIAGAPSLDLLEGYEEDKLEQLENELSKTNPNHPKLISLACDNGIITGTLIHYLFGLRRKWDNNRLKVATIKAEGGTPSQAETNANLHLAQSLNIPRSKFNECIIV